MTSTKNTGWVDLDVSSLEMAQWNYKTEDEATSIALEKNLKKNGQIENIIVRELPKGKFEVINGNHRLAAFQKLKWKTIKAFNVGNIGLQQAKRIAVETNETKFKSDPILLADVIKDISSEFSQDDLLGTMPFSKEELEGFLKLTTLDLESYNSEEPQDDIPKDDDEFKTISLRVPVALAEQWNAQMNRFKSLLYPGDKVSDVSDVMPFEAMIQVLAQTPDDHIV